MWYQADLPGYAQAAFEVEQTLVAVGVALKGLLVGVGYVMDIDFVGGAITTLEAAARELSRVTPNPDGTLDPLSEHHLKAAADLGRRFDMLQE